MTFFTEQESINFFINWLEEKGFTNIVRPEDQFSYYDLEAEYKHPKMGITKWRFELKRRNIESTKFNDSIIEKSKYDKFIEDIRVGVFDEGRVVTFFKDCMVIDNIKNAKDVTFKMAGATTEFENTKVIEKTFVHFNQDKKF